MTITGATPGRPPAEADENGAMLLEFAFVLPVLLAVLLGIITAGSALNRNNSLNNGARETARFAATLPADNLKWWLHEVADVAIDSATGEMADGSPDRYVCVAYVYPDGKIPSDSSVGTDHTVRLEVAPDGSRTITTGSACFDDGRPHEQRRTQVVAERDAKLQFLFFDSTVRLDGTSAARYERFE